MNSNKLIPYSQIEEQSRTLHKEGKRIVFTNGCFDILHAGHVLYLQKAKAMGEVLVLGLNSDASVARLKGNTRPIVNEAERCIVLGGLEAVDYIVIFDEDTPLELIIKVRPDVLVKGGDWSIEQIVGADYVIGYGGEVHSIDFIPGISSSAIIERVIQRMSK
jgi:rfaE bifunctional protein nucleotidyltransferase chain/domain